MKKISSILVILFLLGLPWGNLTVHAENAVSDFEWQDDGTNITITGYHNDSVKAVEIPPEIDNKPVTAVESSAFQRKNLTSVKIPDSVTSIGDSAFAYNQLTSVAIPASVTSIGTRAFLSNQLTSVTISAGVTSIGSFAFAYNLLTNIAIPASVTSIGNSAFQNNQLTSVEIPASVTSIGNNVFVYNKLTSIAILASVTSIGNAVFAYNQLTSVAIPASITSIGSYAFAYNQLYQVIFEGKPALTSSSFSNQAINNVSFNGWYKDEDYIGQWDGTAPEPMTIYGKWDNVTYEVAFDIGGGGDDEINAQTVNYGRKVMKPSDPKKEGYAFVGWYKEETLNNQWDFATDTVTGTMMLYAKWDAMNYAVTFDKNGGDADANPAVITAVYGGNVGTLPTPPTRTGYSFAGWNTKANGQGDPFNATTAVTADITVYAQWTADPVTVTFDKNGGDADANPAVITAVYGGNVGTLPTPPIRTGYTFAGWNPKTTGQGDPFNATTAVTADITVYAQWTANSGGSSNGGVSSPSCDAKVISTDGKLTLPTCGGGEVSLGKDVTVIIPTGASDRELTLTIEKVLDTQELPTERDKLASPIYEILKNFPENFKKPVTLIFAFDPSRLKDTQVPVVFYYDEAKKEWAKISGGKIEGNRISVEVNHFTKFAVFAEDKEVTEPAQDPAKPEISFRDIAGHWAENSIKQAVYDGIVTGYPDGMFKPNHPVTRAEFTVMLAGALKLDGTGAALNFTDRDKIGAWAKRAVALAVQAGIVSGYEDDSFRPSTQITRAEMASMIARALRVTLDANATTSFADNEDIPKWARGAVEAIRKQDIVSGRGGSKFVPNGPATRAEAVVMLLRVLEAQDQQ
ncbi:InlB B-repeat-containing protein [Cohnella nanjingensis]|uniref:Leucine-rich repeat protein n=1 Tax=Cohnella nanjingensis TaxID=1387779 RepID=A0A7X0VDL3_9BACL|nr:InlB B-repeat-containing protein [Cohnella nanjingensis]MBB6670090.1 leucine-rich repeat protein [Cohnella nanjingensis]